MQRARRLRAGLVLALAAFILAFWAYFHLAPPGTEFRAVNMDPEIAYFVSSLAVFEGHPYVFVQHPGTPLEVFGTALLALIRPFVAASSGGFVERSLRHPEVFLTVAHAVLALANMAGVLALGWMSLSVRRWSDGVLAAAVPASYFAFLPQSFFTVFYWSHNAVAFPVGTAVLLGALLALRRGRGRPPSAGLAAALGFAAGVLTATQLYFVTWAIGLAVACAAAALGSPASTRRALGSAAVVVTAAAAGFAVSTLPILRSYPLLVDWLRVLATHQGAYGSGPAGFPSRQVWGANISQLWRGSPALFVASALVLAMVVTALVSARARRHAGWWAAGAGLSLQWIVTVLVMAKHPSRSYLPAVAALLPPLLALAFSRWRRGRWGRLACLALASLAFFGCVREAVASVAAHTRRLATRRALDAEIEQHVAAEAAVRGVDRQSVLVLWGPGLPDAGCYGLWMGGQYSAGALHAQISRVCPSEGLAWSNSTVLPAGWLQQRTVRALLITTEDAPRVFPAFAAFGAPERLSVARDTKGLRLAFFPVVVEDGRARAAPR